jgi:hypothetical protein
MFTHAKWLDHVRSYVSDPSVGEFTDPLQKTHSLIDDRVTQSRVLTEIIRSERDWIKYARSVALDRAISDYIDPLDDEQRITEMALAVDPFEGNNKSPIVSEIEIDKAVGVLRRDFSVLVLYECTKEKVCITAMIDTSEGTVAA